MVVRLGRESGGTLDVVRWEIESKPLKHAVEPDDSTLRRVEKYESFHSTYKTPFSRQNLLKSIFDKFNTRY